MRSSLFIEIKNLIKIFITIFVLTIFLKMFILETLQISTFSMEKTLMPGDNVLVNKLYYGLKIPKFLPFLEKKIGPVELFSFSKIKKGDVVAFYLPFNVKKNNLIFVKRCYAEPGTYVNFNGKSLFVPSKGSSVYLNTENLKDYRNLIEGEGNTIENDSTGLIKINNQLTRNYEFKQNYYFFVGDNINHSYDSRNFGPVSEEEIIGKVVLIYWSRKIENMAIGFLKNIRWNRMGMLVR